MKTLFFGDSLTAGSNSKVKFTDFLPQEWNITNYAVSGTTIGEYSIYPVDGHSLLSQISKHESEIKEATQIFIEYGSNDVSAIMCGFATVQTVVVSLVKALDWIKQLNPGVRIIYLIPGSADVISSRAGSMCRYLEKEYFSKFTFNFPVTIYSRTFEQLVGNIKVICDTISMFSDDIFMFALGEIDKQYISDDGIHPNEQGHAQIALSIINQYK